MSTNNHAGTASKRLTSNSMIPARADKTLSGRRGANDYAKLQPFVFDSTFGRGRAIAAADNI